MFLEQDEDESFPEVIEPRIGGTILADDDLEIGQLLCVHSMKGNNEPVPVLGQSVMVKAICFPFFVVQMLSDPRLPIFTFDVRMMNMMRVSQEYVKAQQVEFSSCTKEDVT